MKIKMTLFRRILTKLLLRVQDKPLPPPTQKEKQLIEEIKSKVVSSQRDASQANVEWGSNMNRLYELVMNDDIRSFLRWDVILRTMFVSNPSFVRRELKYLKNLAYWDNRWSKAIVESTIGHPIPFVFYPKSSGNLIHHAYHLAQLEEKTKINVNEIDFVFEFGGGYGSMCRLFHNIGFAGNYVIFDLPPFSALQEYYLNASSIPTHSVSSIGEKKNGVICLSDIEDFKKTILSSKINKKSKSLFLATWSLSETPIEIRDSIVPLISNFSNVLIAYQNQFQEVDNIKYFKKFKDNFRDMSWDNWEIEHLPGSYYLMGRSTL